MQVSKNNLLDAINKAIREYDEKRAAYDQAAKQWLEVANYDRKITAIRRQRELRNALSAALKNDKPLTEEQLKKHCTDDRYGSSLLSSIAGPSQPIDDVPRAIVVAGKKFERPVGIPRDDLESLKALLEAISDTEVTDGQLQRLGFKNLVWVFRAAIANGTSVAS